MRAGLLAVLLVLLAPVQASQAATRQAPLVLADGKGVVSLRTLDDLVTACEAWGSASCR